MLLSYNQSYSTDLITVDPDADFTIQCFTTGAHIETARGLVAIERLCVGDEAVTASGTTRKIIWIGKRSLDCSGDNAHMAPVRIRANAFGAGVPRRDVLLSPGHPVLVKQDGREVLVPIMNLINGTTIERTQMQSVTYWHIELDQHDVLLADGLPAESFFDMGSRAWFDNDLDDVLANPDLVPTGQHGRCRAVMIDGPLVDAERKRIADLFYAELAGQCAWPTTGQYADA
ncbi:Hint domain-containing protein [Jiella pacifica]|nr:Hint domain-containing protein [Jiella pacifica]